MNRDVIKIVVDNFMDIVKDNMSRGENIYLRGFGLLLKERKEKS